MRKRMIFKERQRDTKGSRIIKITGKSLQSSYSNRQTDRNTIQTESLH